MPTRIQEGQDATTPAVILVEMNLIKKLRCEGVVDLSKRKINLVDFCYREQNRSIAFASLRNMFIVLLKKYLYVIFCLCYKTYYKGV